MAAAANPDNPPLAQEVVLSGSSFAFAWYQWFVGTVAKVLRAPVSSTVPATAASLGVQGQIAQDQNFLYVCVGTNQWKRVALNAF